MIIFYTNVSQPHNEPCGFVWQREEADVVRSLITTGWQKKSEGPLDLAGARRKVSVSGSRYSMDITTFLTKKI